MTLADQLKAAGVKHQPRRQAPLWDGPHKDTPNGGVTQGLLSRFLTCRERFRLLVVEGLKANDTFNHRLEYGNLWHVCEEALAAGADWQAPLKSYAAALCRRHSLQQEDIDKWYNVCKAQFPIYVTYWSRHPDVQARTPLLQEQAFSVPYRLPSGRTVYLRGKWDSVDLVGKGKDAAVWLQENKTKSDIHEEQLKRQLTFDLQTMLYLTALAIVKDHPQGLPSHLSELLIGQRAFPLAGVRYNVIRRPLGGGKGSIVRGKGTKGSKCPKCDGGRIPLGTSCPKCRGAKRLNAKPPESKEAYYARLARYIANEPETYFMRWNVHILPQDLGRFRQRCLDPLLEQLCDWWESMQTDCPDRPWYVYKYSPIAGKPPAKVVNALHWQHPFGCYNYVSEGGFADIDEHILTGSTVGLGRTDVLFPELVEGG